MSGFFSQIAGSLLGNPAVTAAVPGLLGQLLGSAEGANAGGLPGIIAMFEQAGLGAQVQSWVGNGNNLAITAEHVIAAIPPEQLNALADKAGIPHEQVAEVLAQVLPHAVDHATPDGQVPTEAAAAPDFAGLVSKLLG